MADRQKLVLVVDDDEAVRDSLQFALRLEGFSVHTHSGTASVLADPDLSTARCVIVDHRLPRIDGFALLTHLRARNQNVPAILLTSHATARVQARAEAAGVRKVLEKPLLDNALMENIRAILSTGCAAGGGCGT